ncbi:hypothetical protein APHAL10511_001941 [Amanita phalloides]|nr:hypothetical protein APHAL10511_001941 [Amanita phalloides]
MKLIGKFIDKHGLGHVTLRPEDDEDIWHLYNLIQQNDFVRAPAIRRIQTETSTGSTESHRVRLNLTLQVNRLEFSTSSGGSQENSTDMGSPSGHQSKASLSISGRVTSENPHVKLGAYHTLDIEVNRDIRIEKVDGWDSIALARVEDAIIPGRGAEVGAVVCGEGTAAFCLLSQHMTVVTHRISMHIPRKSGASGTSQHEKGLTKFYSAMYDAFIRHIPFGQPALKAIVIASPGWVRESIIDYMFTEAGRRGDKMLQRALREKLLKVHISSPHVHSLVEAIKSPEIVSQLKETKFAREGIALDKFFKMLATDEMRAWYGPRHVCLAADRGAIGTLLISDELFRSSNPVKRKSYVSLVESVQQKGGEVQIFSSMHESGQQLNQLSGIAAILTFPLDIEVVEAEEAEEAAEEHLYNPLSSRQMATMNPPRKRLRLAQPHFNPVRIATPEAAAAVDADPPLLKLLDAVSDGVRNPPNGSAIVYWMRMSDLRLNDNRALSLAALEAASQEIPLLVLFMISLEDYIAHNRSPRRIEFTLRNLKLLKETLFSHHVPLHVICHTPRKTLPTRVISFLTELKCTSLYGNIEYELDELRRDIAICRLAKPQNIQATFVHNKCIIEPGLLLTKQDKTYTVFAPFYRKWIAELNDNIDDHLKDYTFTFSNPPSLKTSQIFSFLFNSDLPDSLSGFELSSAQQELMANVWLAGEDSANAILRRFLYTESRHLQLGAVDPLARGAEDSQLSSRILKYADNRDRADSDTTSRLSVYLSSGVLSSRACVRETMSMQESCKVDGKSDSGVGRWLLELAWRDFYIDILAAHPRLSMGRPYLEKFSSVVWEDHQSHDLDSQTDAEELKRWKEGRTGVPIVDAAMRCLNEMGWIHNRLRMITAMYLTKDLMIDWRVGERYFMEQLIDGDLAANNGGWQWCASTGVDPCPYFRIFNPYIQSSKVDPTGAFIKHWVPELRSLNESDIHKPPTAILDELSYPTPLIEHEHARERALRRYKNPGHA